MRTSPRMIPLLALLLQVSLAPAARAQAPLPPPPVPAGNPITPQKTNLGKVLFWDEQLSSTRTMACGTCHIPSRGGSDPASAVAAGATHPGFDGVFGTVDDVRGSPGVVANAASGDYLKQDPFPLLRQVTGRKAPTMINAAYPQRLFWDGRALPAFTDPLTGAVLLPNNAALESQAAGPPVSDVEMAHQGRDWTDVADRIATVQPLALSPLIPPALTGYIAGRTYAQLFAEAFGSPGVTPARIVMAIATYERSLISNQSPFDAFQAGVPGALTPQQQQGLQVFNGQGRCNLCHGGPRFTDDAFHTLGVRPPFEDSGLGAISGLPQDNGRFKTPTLRNVGLRAPYFHNGSRPALDDVVGFYNVGGGNPINKDPLLIPLNLNPQQRAALVAFLQGGLTDPRVAAELPPFDRPLLYGESDRVPAAYGGATPGSGGFVPRFVALEPPLVASPGFTMAIADGLGGAPAFLALDILAAAPGTTVNGIAFNLGGSFALQFHPLGNLLDVGAGEGWLSLHAALPSNPSLAGQSFFFQAFVSDPDGVGGIAASQGLRMTFFSAP